MRVGDIQDYMHTLSVHQTRDKCFVTWAADAILLALPCDRMGSKNQRRDVGEDIQGEHGT
jgi:hypothetical protein